MAIAPPITGPAGDQLDDVVWPEVVAMCGRKWPFLAKQYESAIKYIEDKRLGKWVHNKTIQKAVESYRVTNEHKDYLRSLRIR